MTSILNYDDYRDVLKDEFSRRSRQNARYSQGAFARDLNIRPSRLSEVLNGKQGISSDVAKDVAKCLKLNKVEASHFVDLVESLHARSRASREAADGRLRRSRKDRGELSRNHSDEFQGQWYHYALIELARLPQFRADVLWISQVLDISVEKVEKAVDDFIDLGLFAGSGPDHFHVVEDFDSLHWDSSVQTDLSWQLLVRARRAMGSQSADERVNRGCVISVNPENIGAVKSLVERFVEDLKSIGQNQSDGTVYCLSTHFFRLSPGPATEEDYH